MLPEPRLFPDRHLPRPPRRLADADQRRPEAQPPFSPRRAARGRGDRPRQSSAAERGSRASFVAGALGLGPSSGNEPELPAGQPTLGTRLRDAGYTVVYKGKWHLTAPLAGGHSWTPADAQRLERDYGFGGWEVPDAGENTDPDRFGGGNRGGVRHGLG